MPSKNTSIRSEKHYMSVRDIAKELHTTESDIICTIYGAMQKLKQPQYHYLKEYQDAEIINQRSSIAGFFEPTAI
jgi:predicted transcriptional regulator